MSYKATECGKLTSMFTHTLYLILTTSCYSVLLSQRYNQTTCSRLSCMPKGLSVRRTKAKL